jgi:hypothetical protein
VGTAVRLVAPVVERGEWHPTSDPGEEEGEHDLYDEISPGGQATGQGICHHAQRQETHEHPGERAEGEPA